MTDNINKSRNLSILEYLNILQKEYIVCILRTKIYTKLNDKAHWKKVAEYKKEKIKTISQRNTLDNIFDDKDIYNQIYKEIVPTFGLPFFIYKDEREKELLIKQDFTNYFYKEMEIKFIDQNNESQLGIIISCSPIMNLVVVKQTNNSEIKDLNANKVRRIL